MSRNQGPIRCIFFRFFPKKMLQYLYLVYFVGCVRKKIKQPGEMWFSFSVVNWTSVELDHCLFCNLPRFQKKYLISEVNFQKLLFLNCTSFSSLGKTDQKSSIQRLFIDYHRTKNWNYLTGGNCDLGLIELLHSVALQTL